MAQPPAIPTTLPLLEHLLNVAARARMGTGRFHLEGVRLEPSAVVLVLGVRGMTRLVDGSYAVTLEIEETGPERTRCRPRWTETRGLARLVGLGARLAPRGLLNDALLHLFGGWMHVEGEQVVLEHHALIAALARRRAGGTGRPWPGAEPETDST